MLTAFKGSYQEADATTPETPSSSGVFAEAQDGATSLDRSISEMQNRSENLAYGLGVMLGRLLGTRDVHSTTASTFGSVSSEGHSGSPSPSVLSAAFHYISTQFKSIGRWTGASSNAINFVATSDWNGALESDILPNIYNDHSLMELGFDLDEYRISTPRSICEILSDQYSSHRFDLMMFSGHGTEDQTRFGEDATGLLTISNVPDMLTCLPEHLTPHAKIIFHSCSTGSLQSLPSSYTYSNTFFGRLFEGYKNWHVGSENIALTTYRYLAKTHPNIEVSAPILPGVGLVKSVDPLVVESFLIDMGNYELYWDEFRNAWNAYDAGEDLDYQAAFKPLKAISYKTGANYNKESVALIDEGYELIRSKPSIASGWVPFSEPKLSRDEWETALEEHKLKTLAALRVEKYSLWRFPMALAWATPFMLRKYTCTVVAVTLPLVMAYSKYRESKSMKKETHAEIELNDISDRSRVARAGKSAR